jgi:hypothetical protein
LGGQQRKLNADLRTFALLGTPWVLSVHDYYPFPLEDGGRLAPTMAAELVDRLAILVAVRRCHGMGTAYFRSLRFYSYIRMPHFVRRSNNIPFRRFPGDMRREIMQRNYAAFHGTLGSYDSDTLHEGSVLMMWHAFVLLGLRLVGLFPPCPFFMLGVSITFVL